MLSSVNRKTDTQKNMCLRKDWTMCWIFANHSRPKSQRDWGTCMTKAWESSPPIITRPMATGSIWMCSASRASCLFHFYEWWVQREKCLNNTHPTSTVKRLLFRVKFQVPTWIATAYDHIASLLGDVLVNKLLQCTVGLVPIKNLKIVGVPVVPILFIMISQYPSTLLLSLLTFLGLLLLRLSSLLLGCHFPRSLQWNEICIQSLGSENGKLMANGPKRTFKYKKPDLGSDFPSYKTRTVVCGIFTADFRWKPQRNCQRMCWNIRPILFKQKRLRDYR